MISTVIRLLTRFLPDFSWPVKKINKITGVNKPSFVIGGLIEGFQNLWIERGWLNTV